MKKIRMSCGHIAYEATADETHLLGGYGICDDCSSFASKGYLVPVLNHYMCENCYKDFSDRASFYKEDVPIEQRTAKYYEEIIPLEVV